MQILVLGDENLLKAKAVVDFASKPENWYYVNKSTFVPGDLPSYTTMLDTYRCVFSITVLTKPSGDTKWRHLSISIPGHNQPLPKPEASFEIAKMFGFTGGDGVGKPGDDWQFGLIDGQRVVVIGQPVSRQIGLTIDKQGECIVIGYPIPPTKKENS